MTTGIVRALPGGSNVVAEVAEVVVDFRDPSTGNARRLEKVIVTALGVADELGLRVDLEWEPVVLAAPMHETIRRAIRESADELGFSSRDIASGAGHDSRTSRPSPRRA